MSAIARFFLLPRHRSQELVAAAQAKVHAPAKKKWGLFKPRLPVDPDPIWTFLSGSSKELDVFPHSGYLLLDVDLLADGALLCDSAEDLGPTLSRIMSSTFVAYSRAGAARAIESLDGADLSDAAIRTYLTEEGRGHEYPAALQPIRDAAARLRVWLGSVTEETTGVLSIG